MGENKGQTIFLSVIGIATLLVAIIGATFAYFTTTMKPAEGSGAGASVNTAKIGTATFKVTAGAAKTNILPGATFNDTTVEVNAPDLTGDSSIDYVCTVGLNVTEGTLTNVKWKLADDADYTKAIGTTFEGKLTSATKTATHVVNAKFMNLDKEQNTEQGATANITVTCDLKDQNVHYSTTE